VDDAGRPDLRGGPAAGRKAENEAYYARFEMPMLAAGLDQRETMELASWLGGDFNPLVDRALLAMYRRQQELAWTEHLVEHVETHWRRSASWGGPGGFPRCASLTWRVTPG
jgi:hypothetical protein